MPSAVISFEDVAPKPMPALWIIVSKGPCLLASAARFLVSVMERRSAIRMGALGRAFWVSWARRELRACRITVWPWVVRCLAVERPIPSVEPVMKMRDMFVCWFGLE